MHITYASDLHLEFNVPKSVFKNWEGDILILAGDILNYKQHGLDTLKYLSDKFNHVIMIMGNHEHYGGKFGLTYNKLKDGLPTNVILLENENIEIDGQRFLGCTLWSWMDEVDCYFASVRMSDYRVIRTGPKNKPWLRKLKPIDTVAVHNNSVIWLKDNIKDGDIVITHHAPSFVSCNPDYTGNSAYATDLSNIILNNNPAYWIHGHLHTSISYEIGNTKIISNPMGYYGEKRIDKFKQQFIQI